MRMVLQKKFYIPALVKMAPSGADTREPSAVVYTICPPDVIAAETAILAAANCCCSASDITASFGAATTFSVEEM